MMPLFISESIETFERTQPDLERLVTAQSERKTRLYQGHTYFKEGRIGRTITPFRVFTKRIIAHTITVFRYITFGTLYRINAVRKYQKGCWRECETRKEWTSVYFRCVTQQQPETLIRTPEQQLPHQNGEPNPPPPPLPLNTQELIREVIAEELQKLVRNRPLNSNSPLSFERIITLAPLNRFPDIAIGIRGNQEKIAVAFRLLLNNGYDHKEKIQTLRRLLTDEELSGLTWQELIQILSLNNEQTWPAAILQAKDLALRDPLFEPQKILTTFRTEEEVLTFCKLMPDPKKCWSAIEWIKQQHGQDVYDRTVRRLFSPPLNVDHYLIERFLQKLLRDAESGSANQDHLQLMINSTQGEHLRQLNGACLSLFFNLLHHQNISLPDLSEFSSQKIQECIEATRTTAVSKEKGYLNILKALLRITDIPKREVLVSAFFSVIDESHFLKELTADELKTCLDDILTPPQNVGNIEKFFHYVTARAFKNCTAPNLDQMLPEYVRHVEIYAANQVRNTLNAIFPQLSEQVKQGGSITLAGQYFQLLFDTLRDIPTDPIKEIYRKKLVEFLGHATDPTKWKYHPIDILIIAKTLRYPFREGEWQCLVHCFAPCDIAMLVRGYEGKELETVWEAIIKELPHWHIESNQLQESIKSKFQEWNHTPTEQEKLLLAL